MPLTRIDDFLETYRGYLETPLSQLLKQDQTEALHQKLIHFFHATAKNVPAYRRFLAERGVDPLSVRKIEDFFNLPEITKQNYLLQHPLPDLCRDGRMELCDMAAASSGSTGKPCFWPRFVTDELEVAVRFEQIFYDSFEADKKRTLAVICFALGTWVGGMYTAACCRHLAAKGYPILLVTPGSNREEIYRAVQELGPYFDQTVLLGYPPFLKSIVDEGLLRGVDWARYGMRWVAAGEVFSEEFRSLMAERMGIQDVERSSASLYGTADAGVLGCETPLSIIIRRWLSTHPDAAHELFGESRLPTLVQYDPGSRFFETVGEGLLFTGNGGIPLVRYDILDHGGILEFEEMRKFLIRYGFDPLLNFQNGVRGARPLPFVYVFGRSDFTVSYFGANIYPENITVGLEQKPISEWVTGKFVLETKEDAERNRHLTVTIELAHGVEGSDDKAELVASSLREHLLRLNSEFAAYVPPAYQIPRTVFRTLGDPEYFPAGVKHRYTRK